MRNFSRNELGKFTGIDEPAYIGFKGKVYDVSAVFKNGEHSGLKAGTDVTSTFAAGPHDEAIFENFPVVGNIVEDKSFSPFTTNSDRIELVLRLALGIIFFAHGSQKLFGWFGGFGWTGTMGYLTGTVHIPALLAGMVMLIEFFGGIAIILGLFTRLAAFGIACTMVGAAVTVHVVNGFFLDKGGVEYVFILLAVSIYLAIRGAGAISLDALINHKNK